MYNAHRGMVPVPSNRLSELLDQVRAEFDNQAGRSSDYEVQRTCRADDALNAEMVRLTRDVSSPKSDAGNGSGPPEAPSTRADASHHQTKVGRASNTHGTPARAS
jgi:hypothetical protein